MLMASSLELVDLYQQLDNPNLSAPIASPTPKVTHLENSGTTTLMTTDNSASKGGEISGSGGVDTCRKASSEQSSFQAQKEDGDITLTRGKSSVEDTGKNRKSSSNSNNIGDRNRDNKNDNRDNRDNRGVAIRSDRSRDRDNKGNSGDNRDNKDGNNSRISKDVDGGRVDKDRGDRGGVDNDRADSGRVDRSRVDKHRVTRDRDFTDNGDGYIDNGDDENNPYGYGNYDYYYDYDYNSCYGYGRY